MAGDSSVRDLAAWPAERPAPPPGGRLDARATTPQLEQQQKLCIAPLLPLKPEVILIGSYQRWLR